MTSDSVSRFEISLRDAAYQRLIEVERVEVPASASALPCDVAVALPRGYGKKKRQRYPLVIVLDAAGVAGSVIEMSRLMAETGEVHECVLVAVETPSLLLAPAQGLTAWLEESLLPFLDGRYRLDRSTRIVIAAGDGGSAQALAFLTDVKVMQASTLPAFADCLMAELGTGKAYGTGITALRKPLLMKLMLALSPLLAKIKEKPLRPALDPQHRLRARSLDRDFEIFVSPPRTLRPDTAAAYPALFVLDANIEFSIVAEAVRRLADDGIIEDLFVIGVGVPRSEGKTGFAFRRFEEFSPPADGYDYSDDLGRIFRSLFAVRGTDARQALGQAPKLLSFLADELIPLLRQAWPLDAHRLGLLGHSAGGTFVGYALNQAASPFSDYIAVSPGIAISGDWLLRQPTNGPLAMRAARARFSIGSEEMTNLFNVIAGIPHTQAYAERLQARALDVDYVCFDGKTHSTVYPPAVAQALLELYRVPTAHAAQQRRAS